MEHPEQNNLVEKIQKGCEKSDYKMDYSIINVSNAIIENNSNIKGAIRRNNVCKHYFYGNNGNIPFKRTLSFSDFKMYEFKRINDNKPSIYQCTLHNSLINKIVAVTYAQTKEELFTANVAGFLCIKNIDFDKQEVSCISSCSDELPGLLLCGDIIFNDT